MLAVVTSPDLSEAFLLEGIRAAEARRDEALAEYQAATAELSWLRDGLRVLGYEDPASSKAKLTELFPAPEVFESGIKPTLRQAIVTIMRSDPTAAWRVNDLAEAIIDRDWVAAKEAPKRISDMASVMVNEKQIVRVARGTYALTPELGAEFELRRRMHTSLPTPKVGDETDER